MTLHEEAIVATWESSNGYLGIQCRLIGNAKPAIWESGGPAHHRIGAPIALFYRHLLNSILAVTQEVTQTRLRFGLSQFRARIALQSRNRLLNARSE
jgi:hypothetical protein